MSRPGDSFLHSFHLLYIEMDVDEKEITRIIMFKEFKIILREKLALSKFVLNL
jgi:hypothetical protein